MQTMLIVEDEPQVCRCLQEFFRRRGFSVAAVTSGEQAVEWLGTSAADVILLDVILPGLSGLEVLKCAKELHPHTRVIMVTALDREEVRETARCYGATAYITKPFDFSEATWAPILTQRE